MQLCSLLGKCGARIHVVHYVVHYVDAGNVELAKRWYANADI